MLNRTVAAESHEWPWFCRERVVLCFKAAYKSNDFFNNLFIAPLKYNCRDNAIYPPERARIGSVAFPHWASSRRPFASPVSLARSPLSIEATAIHAHLIG